MSDWSSWITENPFLAAIGIVVGGPLAIAAMALVVGPIIVLTEASATLGFFALFMIAFFAYFTAALVMDNDEESDEETITTADPITELEQRYVRGELSDEEFEQRLDRIIETEDTVERLDSDSPVKRSRTPRKRETETS